MDNVETPRFKHDCSNCKFLGQHDQYDLYVCANLALIIKTVIARYSSDGPDYMSGLYFAKQYKQGELRNSHTARILHEALIRAEKLGYKMN